MRHPMKPLIFILWTLSSDEHGFLKVIKPPRYWQVVYEDTHIPNSELDMLCYSKHPFRKLWEDSVFLHMALVRWTWKCKPFSFSRPLIQRTINDGARILPSTQNTWVQQRNTWEAALSVPVIWSLRHMWKTWTLSFCFQPCPKMQPLHKHSDSEPANWK